MSMYNLVSLHENYQLRPYDQDAIVIMELITSKEQNKSTGAAKAMYGNYLEQAREYGLASLRTANT